MLFKIAAVKAIGQQILQRQLQGFSLLIHQDHLHGELRIELRQHLPAHPAGGGEPLCPGSHSDTGKFQMALADRFEHGGALSAVGGGVAGVFAGFR